VKEGGREGRRERERGGDEKRKRKGEREREEKTLTFVSPSVPENNGKWCAHTRIRIGTR